MSSSLDAAKQLISAAEKKGVHLKLLGGLAFKALCPSAVDGNHSRDCKDIDVMGKRTDSQKIERALESLGYKGHEIFNKLNMGSRALYFHQDTGLRVDVFFDFVMCHTFDFTSQLDGDGLTLSLANLVMSKLQIIELTENDTKDLLAAFTDYDVVNDGSGQIDGRVITDACRRDWGVWKTFTLNLKKIAPLGADATKVRIERLYEMIEAAPKTFAWRLRARIGERRPWFQTPEAV